MDNNKHIHIHIGPRDSESWLFIAIAVCALGYFWCMASIKKSEEKQHQPTVQSSS